MSNVLRPHENIADVVLNLLDEGFPEIADSGTRLDDVATNLPFVLASVVGGTGDRFARTSTVDIEIFAGTYAEAVSLSERISAYLLGYPRDVGVGSRKIVIDLVIETRPPVELPWDDSSIRRLASTYQISVRR